MSDSSRWYTAMELATLNLPSLGSSKRHINRMALRGAWPSRRRLARGGGREYPVAALPPAAQAALLLRESQNGAARSAARATSSPYGSPQRSEQQALLSTTAKPPGTAIPAGASATVAWAHYEAKPQSLKDKAIARLEALDACERILANGVGKRAALHAVGAQLGIAWQNLNRWYALVKGLPRADWLPALAPKYAGRTATAEIDAEAWDFFKALFLSKSRPPAATCYEQLGREAALRGWSVPALGTLMRRLRREVGAPAIKYSREGEESLKRMFPAQQRDKTAMHALECVCSDGHRLDLFAKWPDGSIGRPIMVAWQDIYSGRVLAWRVDKSENKELVRLTFGDVVERFGIPERVLMDNGRAFASKWISGGARTRYRFKIREEEPSGILKLLGIEPIWGTPYSGQSKPIERAFGDLANHIAKHPAFEGCWIGNRPDLRPDDYDGKTVPLDRLIEVIGREIAAHNAREGRRSPTCNGRSFDAVFAESYAAHPPKKAAPAQRALWLLAAEGVTARAPDGAIHLGRNRYWHERLPQLMGQKLVVRFDPQRLTAPVHVYALDGRFIVTAECVEAAGFLDHEAAQDHARSRNQWRRAVKAQLAAEKRMATIEAGQRLLQIPAPAEAEAPEAKVVRAVFNAPSIAAGEARIERLRARQAEDDAEIAAGLEILEERRRRAG